jgi:hypothetical protein
VSGTIARAGAFGEKPLLSLFRSGNISAMTSIPPLAELRRLRAAARYTRRAAERAQNHDALELLDSVDETLAGPTHWTPRTLSGMATFLERIAANLA